MLADALKVNKSLQNMRSAESSITMVSQKSTHLQKNADSRSCLNFTSTGSKCTVTNLALKCAVGLSA